MTICLIDADVLKYSCGYSIEKREVGDEYNTIIVEPVEHAFYNINSIIKKVLDRCKSKKYKCFLTKMGDRSNYRYSIDPDYKVNRAKAGKPIYYESCHNFILSSHQAFETEGQEADDAVSIEHCTLHPFGFDPAIKNSIICSIDKDFNNVPGWHYNWRRDELYFVTELDALKNFYLQILTGDTCDDIPRIKKRWRKKQAEASLQKATTEQEMFEIVFLEVLKTMQDEGHSTYAVNKKITERGQLVWLRRTPNEMWQIPSTNSITSKI